MQYIKPNEAKLMHTYTRLYHFTELILKLSFSFLYSDDKSRRFVFGEGFIFFFSRRRRFQQVRNISFSFIFWWIIYAPEEKTVFQINVVVSLFHEEKWKRKKNAVAMKNSTWNVVRNGIEVDLSVRRRH